MTSHSVTISSTSCPPLNHVGYYYDGTRLSDQHARWYYDANGIDCTTPYTRLDPKMIKTFFNHMNSKNHKVSVEKTWRVKDDQEKNMRYVATDMPGVRAECLSIDIENGAIKIVGLRFDTNESFELTYNVGTDYDPTTCEASLTHGVLMISIKKLDKFKARRVSVRHVE